MRSERLIVGVHGAGVVLALAAATVWPRPGESALLVPLGDEGLIEVLNWADRENAPLLALDTRTGRVVARITDKSSLLSAIRAGIIPIAARVEACRSEQPQAMR